MYRHEHFDLRLHDNEELAPLVQSDILERVTLHEWPLSCVQRLTLADGRKLIYKTQFGPTVEPEFYANARSSLLPSARTIYRSDGHNCMLLEYVDTPRVQDLDLQEEEAMRIGREVIEQVAAIDGELPYYLDVSDERRWERFVQVTLASLRALVDEDKFSLIDEALVRNLERWACSESVLSVMRTQLGCVHRDLGGDNVFALPDGYRVIDWQRPVFGPTGIDLATFLESLGFDPVPHVGEGIVQVVEFFRINWAVACAVEWLPAGAPTYDEWVTRSTSRILS
jgi:hypothetical protein